MTGLIAVEFLWNGGMILHLGVFLGGLAVPSLPMTSIVTGSVAGAIFLVILAFFLWRVIKRMRRDFKEIQHQSRIINIPPAMLDKYDGDGGYSQEQTHYTQVDYLDGGKSFARQFSVASSELSSSGHGSITSEGTSPVCDAFLPEVLQKENRSAVWLLDLLMDRSLDWLIEADMLFFFIFPSPPGYRAPRTTTARIWRKTASTPFPAWPAHDWWRPPPLSPAAALPAPLPLAAPNIATPPSTWITWPATSTSPARLAPHPTPSPSAAARARSTPPPPTLGSRPSPASGSASPPTVSTSPARRHHARPLWWCSTGRPVIPVWATARPVPATWPRRRWRLRPRRKSRPWRPFRPGITGTSRSSPTRCTIPTPPSTRTWIPRWRRRSGPRDALHKAIFVWEIHGRLIKSPQRPSARTMSVRMGIFVMLTRPVSRRRPRVWRGRGTTRIPHHWRRRATSLGRRLERGRREIRVNRPGGGGGGSLILLWWKTTAGENKFVSSPFSRVERSGVVLCWWWGGGEGRGGS